MSLVSIVIPNHNYGRFVADAVESALAQTYPRTEVIVIDNGSTDDSLSVLRKFGGKIRLITQENRGQSGARNRGVSESRGEWVAFCDADDVWLPEKIARQMELAAPDVGLIYTGYHVADEKLNPIRRVEPKNRGRVLHKFAEDVAAVIPGGESTVMIRRRCFAQVGGFDPALSISAGFDLYRRVAQHYDVEYVADPLMLYRQHGGNASKRVPLFERDIFMALQKMFGDAAAVELEPLRRACYGRTHISLCGAYFHSGDYASSIRHLMQGIFYSPKAAQYALEFPIRALKRLGAR